MTCEQCQQSVMKLFICERRVICPTCRDRTRGESHQAATVIDDSIPGGFVQEHFGVTPETFYSKKDMARRAKELGLVSFVRHVGEKGSDKSPHTTRWI